MEKNLYVRGYLRDIYLRPSCHDCPSRCSKSGSDLTIGDFWGISQTYPQYENQEGVSWVLVNSETGLEFLKQTSMKCAEVEYEKVVKFNPRLMSATPLHHPYIRFLFFLLFPIKGIQVLEILFKLADCEIIQKARFFYRKFKRNFN